MFLRVKFCCHIEVLISTLPYFVGHFEFLMVDVQITLRDRGGDSSPEKYVLRYYFVR